MKQKQQEGEFSSRPEEIRFKKRPFKFTSKQSEVIAATIDPESQIVFIKGQQGYPKHI